MVAHVSVLLASSGGGHSSSPRGPISGSGGLSSGPGDDHSASPSSPRAALVQVVAQVMTTAAQVVQLMTTASSPSSPSGSLSSPSQRPR